MSSLATPVREGDDPADLWRYLQPLLSETTLPADGGFVKQLLTLPRVRRVELLPNKMPDGTFGSHIRTFQEKTPRDVASIIIQATGDVPPEPCQRCLAGKGLMKGCVVIATKSCPDARRRYYSCANCLYHGNQTYCSLKPWVIDRPQPDYNRPNTSEVGRFYEVRNSAQGTPSERSSVSAEVYTRESASRTAQPVATGSPFGAGASSYDAASENRDVRNAARPQRALPPVPPPRQWARSANAAPARQPVAQASSSSLISAGVIQPSDILEMETWEMAPGRIRESAGPDAESESPVLFKFGRWGLTECRHCLFQSLPLDQPGGAHLRRRVVPRRHDPLGRHVDAGARREQEPPLLRRDGQGQGQDG